MPVLDHDPGIGGRFSVLSNVGLLPAAVLDLDIAAVREGAGLALAPVLAKKKAGEVPAAIGAALAVALAETKGKSISVLMAYADRLERFTRWYVQLWAESLGKNGKGTTPVAALGPVDQHSQVQLVHRRTARQIVHRRHRRCAPATGRAWTARSPSSPASPALPARPSAISSPRKPAPPPRPWPRTAARCAPSI